MINKKEAEKFSDIICKATHEDLLRLKDCLEHEIHLSEQAIAEGFE